MCKQLVPGTGRGSTLLPTVWVNRSAAATQPSPSHKYCSYFGRKSKYNDDFYRRTYADIEEKKNLVLM